MKSKACNRLPEQVRGRGFTLIELMVTLAITTILLAIGVPSFSDFIATQRVKTAAIDLGHTMTFARSEAIKRNADIVIEQASGGWQNGWNVTWTTSGESKTLRQQSPYSGLTISTPVSSLTYRADGRLADATMPTFEISGSGKTRCVSVSLSGTPNTKTGSCS